VRIRYEECGADGNGTATMTGPAQPRPSRTGRFTQLAWRPGVEFARGEEASHVRKAGRPATTGRSDAKSTRKVAPPDAFTTHRKTLSPDRAWYSSGSDGPPRSGNSEVGFSRMASRTRLSSSVSG